MKRNNASANKMIKSFDKELKKLLLTDLKVIRIASKSFVNNINRLNATLDNKQLSVA